MAQTVLYYLFRVPPFVTLCRIVVLPARSGRAVLGTREIPARAARIAAVPVRRRRMPRFFEREEEILDAVDVEVQWEEIEGAVVWPVTSGANPIKKLGQE